MPDPLPLLPTTVCGSHGLPSWFFLVREAVHAWVGVAKLRSMVEAARLVRRELRGV